MNYYSAFGLTICSEITCSYVSTQPTDLVDVYINKATIPDYLPNNDPSQWYQRFENKILYQDPPTGKFLIENGTHIYFELPADMNIHTTILPSFVFGSLLQQRDNIVLHANAVVKDGKALLLMGPSGYGKSTLTYSLTKLGCSLLTDDLSVIDFTPEGIFVQPGSTYLKLTPDTIERFKINDVLQPVSFGSVKSYLPVQSHASKPMQIAGIFLLEKSDTALSYTAEKIKGIECIKALLDNIYLANECRFSKRYFLKCAEIVEGIPFWRLKRHKTTFTGYQIADFLFNQFFNNEKVAA